ncbi:MAG TPA: VanW family protein [Actinomycetales bacterium]|nr:VanW family protein [Actinomycetales bacterium]
MGAYQARAGSSRWPWAAGAVLALLIVGYGAAAWAVSDRVPAGVTIGGFEIGGQSRDQAVATLQQRLGPVLGDPVVVTAGGKTAQMDPVEAGLALDIPATVDGLVGFTLNPVALWRHLSPGDDADVAVIADDGKLGAVVTSLAEDVDRKPVEGAVTFADGKATATPAQEGEQLDQGAAVEQLKAKWPSPSPIALPMKVTQPQIDSNAVEKAMSSFAVPATAGPLIVEVGDKRTELPPEAFTPALAMQPKDGELVPVVDGEALKAALLKANTELDTKPQDARIELSGGKPVVVPGKNGVSIDAEALAAKVTEALPTPARTAKLDVAVVEPELTTAEAEKLGVKEKLSEFSSSLTANSARTENLRIAARTINGTLLLPGETFSLNGVLGQRTPGKGYNKAGTISGGRFIDTYGGGVSQMATTMFNGMFFAGLQDVFHKPHSLYISRYPEGREATVNWPDLDLKFKNDSEYGVLIETWVSGGQVHTRFWGTKVWDITASKGPRHNFRQPKTITDTSPKCTAQSSQQGFDVDVTRTFSRGGQVVKRETFSTSYSAQDQVICKKPEPKETKTPSPTTTAPSPTATS